MISLLGTCRVSLTAPENAKGSVLNVSHFEIGYSMKGRFSNGEKGRIHMELGYREGSRLWRIAPPASLGEVAGCGQLNDQFLEGAECFQLDHSSIGNISFFEAG